MAKYWFDCPGMDRLKGRQYITELLLKKSMFNPPEQAVLYTQLRIYA